MFPKVGAAFTVLQPPLVALLLSFQPSFLYPSSSVISERVHLRERACEPAVKRLEKLMSILYHALCFGVCHVDSFLTEQRARLESEGSVYSSVLPLCPLKCVSLYHNGQPKPLKRCAGPTSSHASRYIAVMLLMHCWYAEKVRKFRWFSSKINCFSRLVAAFLCMDEDALKPSNVSYDVGQRAEEQVL